MDGTRILLDSNRLTWRDLGERADFEVLLLELPNTNPYQQLTSRRGGLASFVERGGTQLIFRSGREEFALFFMDYAEGPAATLLCRQRFSTGLACPARASPDGQLIAFETDGDVWLFQRSTGGLTDLGDGLRPSWFRDGRRILFTKVMYTQDDLFFGSL